MRTLVTGGNGFLGKTFIEYLINKNLYDVDILCVDNGLKSKHITNFERGTDHYHVSSADVVFHFAGNPIVKVDDSETETKIHYDNILLTQRLLANCRPYTKFYFISSATVYGYYNPPPNEDSPFFPQSIYAGTKAAAEQLVRAYKYAKNLEVTIIRPSAITGKYATHGLVFDIIRKLDSDSEYLELLGNYPGSKKPYLDANWFAKCLCHMMETRIRGIFNIAAPDSIDVEDVANVVMDAYGKRKPIKFLGSEANWNGDNHYVSLDISDIKDLCGMPPTSKQAIRNTIQDILAARNAK